MDFAKIVLDRLSELDLNVNQAEARFGFSQGYLRGVVRQDDKRAVPSIEKASKIAQALGISYLIGSEASRPETVFVDGDEFAKIPLLDAFLSAGPGRTNGDEEIIGHLAFRRDWLTRMGVALGHARIARAKGISMAPAIADGDLVMVDTSKTLEDVPLRTLRDRRSPPVYAFLLDGLARIKRVKRLGDESLVLLSDDPTFEVEVIDPSDRAFHLLGKVVWSGHVWR